MKKSAWLTCSIFPVQHQNWLYQISLILRSKRGTFNWADWIRKFPLLLQSGGGGVTRVLISSVLSRFTLHCEAINNPATGLEKYFYNLPWQVFPVAQLRNLMLFFQGATDTRLCLARNECDPSSKTKSVNWCWCGVKADLVCTISTFWGIYVGGLCAVT